MDSRHDAEDGAVRALPHEYHQKGGYSGRSVSSWRESRAQAGGGVLIMNVAHYLDLLRLLTGREVEEVSAIAVSSSCRDVEDNIFVIGRFSGGAGFSVMASSAVAGADDGDELRLWGTDGHLELAPTPKVFPLRGIADLTPARWQTLGDLSKFGVVDTKAVFFSRFATAVHRKAAFEVTADDGLAVQALIEAIYRSADERISFRPEDLLKECRSA